MVRPEVKKRRRREAEQAALSRKARKQLQKVVLHKKAKLERSTILKKLKQCQLPAEQLQQLHSTSSMQTKGLKRFLHDDSARTSGPPVTASKRADQCLDTALLLARKRRKKVLDQPASSSSDSEDTDAVSTDSDNYKDASEDFINLENEPKSSTEAHPRTKRESTPAVSKEPQPNTRPQKPTKIDTKPDKAPPEPKPRQPAVHVPVLRDPATDEARLKLPIINEEQRIVESIRYNDVVILSGETGSGKTTQVPQFLYEAGYALNGKLIGITEPRRVAAVSMSERVAKELNLTSESVSYQIRFSGNVTNRTKIKFMTDGVLLRECQNDFLLTKYSVIIIDEAHERSEFSDILIGLLSRIVPLRAKRDNPLKLIIMSATLRVKDFTENTHLFRQTPPVIHIEARQFPVSVRFARQTPENYLLAAYRKICSVHAKLPRGGILVFVTSQLDVRTLCRKLRERFPSAAPQQSKNTGLNVSKSKTKISRNKSTSRTGDGSSTDANTLTIDMMKQNIELDGEQEEELDDGFEFKSGRSRLDPEDWDDAPTDSSEDEDGIIASSKSPLHCVGLYAMLPIEKQRLVFQEPPEGSRLCVIATNVAETSITIPNIKYVIDTGKEKSKQYDLVTGVSKFVTGWTSKASAEQRKGRAGRVGPGLCFRLYSSAVFTNDFDEFAQPKILQKPVDDLMLQMKSMNIDNVVNFPFPTRPSLEALMAAEKKLIALGALDDSRIRQARFHEIEKAEFSSRPTALGRAMACFALSARCSKMIVLSPADLLPHVIALVSALTVREMFLEGDKWRDLKKKWAGHGNSKLLGDFGVMVRAICAADKFACSHKQCLENGLRTKAMLEIDKLRQQLTGEVNNNLNYPSVPKGVPLKRPSGGQAKLLRQLLLASYCDHVAQKLPDGEVARKNEGTDPKTTPRDNKTTKKKLKHAYECADTDKPVHISVESVLKGEHPELVIYKELYEANKTYMRDMAVIEREWLPLYAPSSKFN